MKTFSLIAGCILLSLLPTRPVDAHGTPIFVGQNLSNLVVSNGLIDSAGYALNIFVEDDEDGNGELAPGPVPGVGNAFLWEIPGFNISGLNSTSSLSIEVLAPSVTENPTQKRTLWYWNADDGVVDAESSLYLLGTGLRNQPISPNDTASLPPFMLANPVGDTAAQGGQQGFHNHGLLTYALDYNIAPAFGAYGFFARLTSSDREPSDPFLIVLNFGVEYEEMFEAALAINAAAADTGLLPGDYNFDGTVNAADYIVWRKGLSAAGGYDTWHDNFGRTSNAGSGAVNFSDTQVPEPATVILIGCAAIIAIARQRRNRARRYQGR